MPYGALERPALGLGLLKATLTEAGTACDVRYFSLEFADYIGAEEYRWVQSDLPHIAFAGEWTFAGALHRDHKRDDGYLETVLRGRWGFGDDVVSRLLRIRAYTEHFLANCIASVAWHDYDVVGFTSTFEQNVASLALARRVKRANPRTAVVFGGANWEGEMGVALHERFPFVDFVCSGEADESFPALVACVARGQDPVDVPGVVYRRDGVTRETGPANLVRDLDSLPFPDFDDFYEALEDRPAALGVTPLALLETSRGCWWGAKHHCTFCGLNGGTMAFRAKSGERALAEIRHLRARYGAERVSVVDNILDMRYFHTLLPELAQERLELDLFYEVKANLTRELVRLLAEAGVRTIQPGVESFSDQILGLMRKGTTGLQNVQLLKWCREFGVRAEWNLLYGFPGEDPAEYEAMVPLLEAIRFLDPPGAYGVVRLDRFSPYHAEPAAHGLTRIRPIEPYAYLYPFDEETLRRIAYYFDYDYVDGRSPESYAEPALAVARSWMARGPQGGVWTILGGDGSLAVIRDDGDVPGQVARLEGWQADAYVACDSVQSVVSLARMPPLLHVGRAELGSLLEWLVAHRLMLEVDGRYLSLAVSAPPNGDLAEAATVGALAVA